MKNLTFKTRILKQGNSYVKSVTRISIYSIMVVNLILNNGGLLTTNLVSDGLSKEESSYKA